MSEAYVCMSYGKLRYYYCRCYNSDWKEIQLPRVILCWKTLHSAAYCATDTHTQSCVCSKIVNNRFSTLFINRENVKILSWKMAGIFIYALVGYPRHHIWLGFVLTHLFLHQFHGNALHSFESNAHRRLNCTHARSNVDPSGSCGMSITHSVLHSPLTLIAYTHVLNYSSYAWYVVCVRMCA